MASGAADILVRARIVPTLDEALDGVQVACATAMTPRDFGPPTEAPRACFERLAARPDKVAFVFGSERFGLANEDVYRCHVCLSIPTHPDYGSLNLAQAVQLRGLRVASGAGRLPGGAAHRRRRARRRRRGRRARSATGSRRWCTWAFSIRRRRAS